MEGVGTEEAAVLNWINPEALPTTPRFEALDLANSGLVHNLSPSIRCRTLPISFTTATAECLKAILGFSEQRMSKDDCDAPGILARPWSPSFQCEVRRRNMFQPQRCSSPPL